MMFGSFSDLAFIGVAAGTGVALDPDAQSYITAVETVDGQALEAGVRAAINDFVVGCKADGIWTAIKASCILAGARTLNGALRPLVGTAPTNFNFVDGDYNRKTGLVGNGSTKYLNSNRASSVDGQNNFHQSVYVNTLPSSDGVGLIGVGSIGSNSSHIAATLVRNRSATSTAITAAVGLVGTSRSGSSSYIIRNAGSNSTAFTTTSEPDSLAHFVFSRNAGSLNQTSNARLAFYSIGESLNLALLDARVTDLINAFGAAIP
jgi:hypothetical protein